MLDAGAFIAVDRDDRAMIARLLRAVDIRAVDDRLARDAGVLLGRAGAADPIDATVVLVAESGDRILTSDPGDLRRLADPVGARVAVVPC